MTTKKTNLLVCGSIAIDRIMNFDGHYKDVIKPDKIHVLSLSVLLKELKDTRGGTGANIAYNLALLGESPLLLGSVGHDAKEYIQSLENLGIDTTYIHYSDKKTASFTVMTDQDDNQVGGFYPGAMADSASLSLAKWKDENVFVVVSAHDPEAMRKQVKECKKYGLRLFYDISQQISMINPKSLKEALDVAELVIVNDYEFTLMSEKTGLSPTLLKKKVPVMVITKGKEGSIVTGKRVNKDITVSIAKPTKLADPTGAGDAYRAGFLYGYVRGWDFTVSSQLGAVTASFAIEHHGTQNHHFTKKNITARFRSSFGETIVL